MSYSIDRSARTRGVGAVAAMDLRHDNGGGAVVRTGRGPVVIVAKPHAALGFSEALGGWNPRNPYRNQLPWNVKKAIQWEKDHAAFVKKADRRGALKSSGRKIVRPKPKGRRMIKVKVVRTPAGLMTVPAADPSAMMAPPSSSSSPITGGGGGGGGFSYGGGGGGAPEPSTPPPEDEGAPDSGAPAQEATEAEAAPVKPPMSTGMKVGLVAAAGWALFSIFGKGH